MDNLEAVMLAGEITALLCWIPWLIFSSEKYSNNGNIAAISCNQ